MDVGKEEFTKIIEGLVDINGKSVKNALISFVNNMGDIISVNDSVYQYVKDKNAFGSNLNNKNKVFALWNSYGNEKSSNVICPVKTNPNAYGDYLLSKCLDEKDPTLNNKILKWVDGKYPQYIESIRVNYKDNGIKILKTQITSNDIDLKKEQLYQRYLRCELLRDLVNCKENILVSLRTYNMLNGVIDSTENKGEYK